MNVAGYTDVFSLTIPGQPKSKDRPRARVLNMGGRSVATMYSTAKSKDYERMVNRVALASGLKKLGGQISVSMRIVFSRPRSLMRKKDPDGLIIHAKKPDVDNVIKSVLDGLSGFFDDKKVWSVTAQKFYAEKEGGPRVEMMIYHLLDD